MKVTFSKKVQAQQFEPVFYMADLTPEDIGLTPSPDPAVMEVIHSVLFSMCRKAVLDAMRKSGHVSEEEYAKEFPTFMTHDQIEQLIAAVKD